MNDSAVDVIFGVFGGSLISLLASYIIYRGKRDADEIAYRVKRDSDELAYKTRQAEADAQLRELELRLKYSNDRGNSYKAIGEDAVDVLEKATNERLISRGDAPITPMAAVLANHHSLVTQEELDSANFETMKAQVAAARKALELPPKEPGEVESEDQRTVRLAEEAKIQPRDLGGRLTTVLVDRLDQKLDKALEKADELPNAVVDEIEKREEGK